MSIAPYISAISSSFIAGSQLPVKSLDKDNKSFLFTSMHLEHEQKSTRWNAKALSYIKSWEDGLEEMMSPNLLQRKIEGLGETVKSYLETPISHVKSFNQWIDKNSLGGWYEKLANFLIKLPIRAVRNILRLVYNLVKGMVHGFVHPLEAGLGLLKFLVRFIDELSKPETYIKVGGGISGASLGQLAIIGGLTVPSYIGLGIGGGMMLVGLTAGAIEAAVKAEKGHKKEAVKETLWEHVQTIPECMLTGFVMGAIVSGIQKSIFQSQMQLDQGKALTPSQAKDWVNAQFISQHPGLTPPSSVVVEPSGKITILWKGNDLAHLTETVKGLPAGPKDFTVQTLQGQLKSANLNSFQISLSPGKSTTSMTITSNGAISKNGAAFFKTSTGNPGTYPTMEDLLPYMEHMHAYVAQGTTAALLIEKSSS